MRTPDAQPHCDGYLDFSSPPTFLSDRNLIEPKFNLRALEFVALAPGWRVSLQRKYAQRLVGEVAI